MKVVAARAWMRRNLFRNRRDVLLTVIAGAVVAWALWRIGRFVLITGRWEVVRTNLGLFLYGRYPRGELWRIAVTVVTAGFAAGGVAGAVVARHPDHAAELEEVVGRLGRVRDLAGRLWPFLALVVLLLMLSTTAGPFVVALATGGAIVLGRTIAASLPRRVAFGFYVFPVVPTIVLLPLAAGPLGWDAWGGIMLTLFIASVSMLACFPLGVLLALGRRSSLPAVRVISVGVIEFFRGVPLVVLVLMSSVALGFFFPQELLPGAVVRVMVAFTIFTSAYVAEIVRGGLQSVPKGQVEAAQALGLSAVRIVVLIVLPQALRNVIPALVGQFISLFKDTTLVFIIGFLDVLSVAQDVTKQPDFRGLGLLPETLIFAAMLFWVGSYTLSRESQRLERRLGVGVR